jgi:hypothetical protein
MLRLNLEAPMRLSRHIIPSQVRIGYMLREMNRVQGLGGSLCCWIACQTKPPSGFVWQETHCSVCVLLGTYAAAAPVETDLLSPQALLYAARFQTCVVLQLHL